MRTVQSILQTKGEEVRSVTSDASVYDALELLAKHNIGALVVIDGREVVGMISERDYARKVVLRGGSSRGTRVSEIMSRDVIVTQRSQDVEECMTLMKEHRIRHLPVMENDHIVGVISIGDIVNALLEEQEARIHQLEDYICSG